MRWSQIPKPWVCCCGMPCEWSSEYCLEKRMCSVFSSFYMFLKNYWYTSSFSMLLVSAVQQSWLFVFTLCAFYIDFFFSVFCIFHLFQSRSLTWPSFLACVGNRCSKNSFSNLASFWVTDSALVPYPHWESLLRGTASEIIFILVKR